MVKYTKKKVYRKSRKASKPSSFNTKSIQKVVSRMIMKKVEPKHKNFDHGKTELYHNLINTVHLNKDACMPSQGTQDQQRIGDRIDIGGFMVRMLNGQKTDRVNVNWKFWVLRVPRGEPVGYSNLFEAITNNTMIDPLNKDYATVLKSYQCKKLISTLHNDTSPWAQRELTFPTKLWIPYKKSIKFLSNASTDHNDHDIYLVWVAYDAFGTLTTDNIAYSDISSTVYYKDP